MLMERPHVDNSFEGNPLGRFAEFFDWSVAYVSFHTLYSNFIQLGGYLGVYMPNPTMEPGRRETCWEMLDYSRPARLRYDRKISCAVVNSERAGCSSPSTTRAESSQTREASGQGCLRVMEPVTHNQRLRLPGSSMGEGSPAISFPK